MKRRLSEKELAPIRKEFYTEFAKNPKISCEEFAKSHKVARTTVFGWRRKPVIPKVAVTSVSIADALLVKVVKAIREHDELVSKVNTLSGNLRVCKDETLELKDALKKEVEEKERILKIHNQQVQSRNLKNLASVDELKKLAGLPVTAEAPTGERR